MATDQAELNAIMAGSNADSKRTRELTKSIADRRLDIIEKTNRYNYQGGRFSNGNYMKGQGTMYGSYGGCW
jgi:hypothetical protein